MGTVVAGRVENLTPWQPGQTGNPEGHSRARRARKALRDATARVLEADLPDELVERIAQNLQGLDSQQVADLIATRLALAALDPSETRWMDAVSQLRQIEGGVPEPQQAEEPRAAPEIPDSTERMEQVREALIEAGELPSGEVPQ